MTLHARVWGVVGPLATAAGVASAQMFAGVGVAFTQHRVDAGYGVEISSGPLVTGEVGAILWPRVRGALALRTGSLRGRTGGATDRTVAAIEARAGYQARSWLVLDGALTVRTYSAEIGLQRWVLLRMGGEARVPFLSPETAGVVRFAVLPIASATGLGRSDLAFVAGAGVAFRRDRFGLEVLYTLERFDFPPPSTTLVDRHEELSALVLRVSAQRGVRPAAPPVTIPQ